MNKNIKVIPFPGIPNAYVVISGVKAKTSNGCEKRMTFFYGTEAGGCEWEPECGSITKIIPLKKEDAGAIPHWFYDYYAGRGYWSQLAVERCGLPEYFLSGDYEGLFSVLKDWAS